MPIRDIKETVRMITEEAGNYIMQHRSENQDVHTKEHAFDYATKADKEAEKIIIKGIRKQFPNDSILCEETGYLAGAKDYASLFDTLRMPLDGF
jgi:fructose-1,6-bisphosphatase/inositol monophosphatase family enzyme